MSLRYLNLLLVQEKHQTKTAYKYGIEIGAQFDENFIVNAGWKESYYDEHGVSIDIHGLYLGAGYRF
ncbi:hypothetical protein JCM19236_3645 [Vibrio sp. JCM 19236]|nr:hypothetical protein JCM19236_3645 [Vibrio sp. JCM 19236]